MEKRDSVKKEIRRYLSDWKYRLLLEDWNIIVQWHREMIPDHDKNAGGVITPDWRYMEATLHLNLGKMKLLTKQERERMVVHELLHCLTNPLKRTGADQEELLVTRLALILVPHRVE